MEARDRQINMALFGAAVLAWLLVGVIVTSRDPTTDLGAGAIGALAIGFAVGLTCVPLFWLAAFGRHRRIAYRGDWVRATRRGGWVAALVILFVALRLQGIMQPPIMLFVLAMVVVAETTLSVDR
jgi:hypothetical protein